MHDRSDDRKSTLLGIALAVGTIVLGAVAAIATGPLQVGAWLAMVGCLGGNIASGFFEFRESRVRQPWPESDQSLPVAVIEADSVALAQDRGTALPEKSWVASLDRSKQVGRSH